MRNRIVIADDDPTMRAALGEALASAGYHTDVFADGEAAERHLKQNGADLVVSDVRMPNLGLSGAAVDALVALISGSKASVGN